MLGMQVRARKNGAVPRDERMLRLANGYFLHATTFFRSGEKYGVMLGRAIRLYDAAIAESPRKAALYNNRALVHEINGDFESAFLDFEAAKRLCNGNRAQAEMYEMNSLETAGRIDPKRQKALAESIQMGI
ncbi:MAG: hypothetical protein WC717_01115 [Candidatus Micrarchaeia archaeon]|jgi:tetratricopeptide (TPR) repeat protein